MSRRTRRDRGGAGTSFVVTVLVALAGGGAAVAATTALVNAQAPAQTADTVVPATGLVQGPSDAILDYGQ